MHRIEGLCFHRNWNHLRCSVGIGRIHQLLTDRESTAFLRLATGVPFGFGLGLFFAAAYSARPNKFSSVGQVRLPGNVRFQKVTQEEE